MLFWYLIAPFVSWGGVISAVGYEEEEKEDDGKMKTGAKEDEEEDQDDC